MTYQENHLKAGELTILVLFSIVFLSFMFWLTQPPLLGPLFTGYLVDYLIAVIIFTGVWLFFAWASSFLDMELGAFVVDGSIQEILTSLRQYHINHGAQNLTISSRQSRVSIYGLTEIIDDCLINSKIAGDRIDFDVKSAGPKQVKISVFARRSWNSRGSFTKQEWAAHGYDRKKILDLMTEFGRIRGISSVYKVEH
jgi:hypothetical protein